ncbi:serine/arginine-rich SC35-like splicing factor SCL30A [Tanacetum coccineum]
MMVHSQVPRQRDNEQTALPKSITTWYVVTISNSSNKSCKNLSPLLTECENDKKKNANTGQQDSRANLFQAWEPRGFGFVQFLEPADAAEAKYQMDGQVLQGRQLTVVFAEENRKKPTDMRTRERRGGSGRFNDRRRSLPRYSRSPPPRYSRSPPRYARSRSNSREYSPPPKRKQHVRSVSPGEKRHSRERSYSRSPPPARGRSPPPRSPVVDNRSPPYNGSRSPSPLPARERSRSPARERARAPRDPSRSPVPRDYSPSP